MVSPRAGASNRSFSSLDQVPGAAASTADPPAIADSSTDTVYIEPARPAVP